MMRRLFIARIGALSLVMLGGCISIGNGDPSPLLWYELELAQDAAGPAAAARGALALQLDVVPGSSFYDALAIAYSRAPGQRAYYRFANWTEPVASRIARLARARFDARGGFASVGGIADGGRADRVLKLVVTDFYHDVSAPPGRVRVGLELTLVDPRAQRVLGRHRVDASDAVTAPDAASAASAFGRALGAALDESIQWVAPHAR